MEEPQYKCGYCGWLFHSVCENYLEHICFKNRLIPNKSMDLVSNENNVLTLEELNKTQSTGQLNNSYNLDNYETENYQSPLSSPDNSNSANFGTCTSTQINDELLISAVYSKKPLWDFRIPVAQRSNLKVKQLWQEIYQSFEGLYNIEMLKKRWRQLRDDFMRAKKKAKTYVPSGSGANDVPPKPTFKYYDVMKFLDDVNESTNSTVSNIIVGPTSGSSQTDETVPLTLTPSPGEKRKRGSLQTSEQLEFQKLILNSLQTADCKPDGVDGFLTLIGEGLRRLPLRNRNRLQLTFLQMLEEAETSLE